MNATICDASVLFKLLVTETHSEQAAALVRATRIIVPEFAYLEVGNALWSRIRRGDLDVGQAKRLIDGLLGLGLETLRITPFLARAMELACAIDHPIYDCLYLAMAEDLAVPLVTADKRLGAAVRRARVRTCEIQLLGESV